MVYFWDYGRVEEGRRRKWGAGRKGGKMTTSEQGGTESRKRRLRRGVRILCRDRSYSYTGMYHATRRKVQVPASLLYWSAPPGWWTRPGACGHVSSCSAHEWGAAGGG